MLTLANGLKSDLTNGFKDEPMFSVSSGRLVMISFAQRINAASAGLRQLGGKFSVLNMQTPPQTQGVIEMSPGSQHK